MICQTCKNDGILNSVNGEEFYYCRTCKVEIMLTVKEPDIAFDDWPEHWIHPDTTLVQYYDNPDLNFEDCIASPTSILRKDNVFKTRKS